MRIKELLKHILFLPSGRLGGGLGGLLILLFLPLSAYAQKFALVDMEYILKNIPAYERANEQLSQVSKKWQAEVEALSTEAQTMYKN